MSTAVQPEHQKYVPHPCSCTACNGSQCYNCLNGAHTFCDNGCKRRDAKQRGVMIVIKGRT